MSKERKELPPGWVEAPLGDLGEWFGGGTPSKSRQAYWDGGTVPWVSPKDMKVPEIADTEDHITELAVAESATQLVPAGSLLFVVRSGILAHDVPLAVNRPTVSMNQDMKALHPRGGLSSGYLLHVLRSRRQAILDNCRKAGTTVASLNFPQLRAFRIPIAPLPEQHRIVAKIEELQTHSHRAREALEAIPDLIERFRQSVLGAAFRGDLTADWREARSLPAPKPNTWYVYAILCEDQSIYIGQTEDLQRRWREHRSGEGAQWTKRHKPLYVVHWEELPSRDEAAAREKWLKTGFGRKWLKRELKAGRLRQTGTIEPASELLKRILAERRKRWEDAERDKLKAKGLTGDKLAAELAKRRKKCKEPTPPDTTDLPGLPEGWCWTRWEQVGFCQNGRAFPSKHYASEGMKLLRPGNLHASGAIEWTEHNTRRMPWKWVSDHPSYVVGPDELVVNLTAQSLKDEFLGRVCLTGPGEECLLNQRIARLTPVGIESEFCLWLLKSPVFRSYVDGLNTGSLIQHMFTSQIMSFVLPLPPAEEQRMIVGAITGAFQSRETTNAAIADCARLSSVLDQSILAKAFRGELVPQNPSDEPASPLLERISVPSESSVGRGRRGGNRGQAAGKGSRER